MSPKKAKKWNFILLGLLLLGALGGAMFEPLRSVGFVVGILALIGWVVILLLFWRCPDCHRMLPTQGMLGIRNCPYCGTELSGDE